MISFKQFLSENQEDPIDMIKRDCQPFLKIWGSKALVRGMKGVSSGIKPIGEIKNSNDGTDFLVFKRKVRKDRQPLDTNTTKHEAANRWFKKKFGVSARSEALFCYPQKALWRTEDYGTAYMIFPIGEFKIIWSPDVPDLFSIIDFGANRDENRKKTIPEILDGLEFRSDDPSKALNSGLSELMVVCDEYYAVEYPAYEQIKNDL